MGKVAFILGDMFEDSEFEVPYKHVEQAGHEPVIVGVEAGAQHEGKKGTVVTTDASIDDVDPKDFVGLVIPGGYSPDKIRTSPGMVP